MEEEKRLTEQVSVVGISGNVFLSLFKFAAGVFGHSSAMISDAVHSLSDVLATAIALIGVKLSRRSADRGHPYGHERFESIASLILSFILFLTGAAIGYAGLRTIFSGNYETIVTPGLLPLAAAGISIISKEAMYRFTRSRAEKLHSPAFMADAWHHRTDALSSVGSLIGILGARAGYPVLDSVASVVICAFILKVAVDIFLEASRELTDSSCDEAYTDQLKSFVEEQSGVDRVDLLNTRLFGEKVYVDLEIAVDADLEVQEAHEIAETVHTGLEEKFSDIKDVMVHVNPYEA